MNYKTRVSYLLFFLATTLVLGISNSCKSNDPTKLGECEKGNLMELEPTKIISAQVLLKSASGKAINTETIITSENIKDYLVSSETVTITQKYFTDAGFEVGEQIGVSFSITAPVSKFEKMFRLSLCLQQDGGITALGEDNVSSYELPLSTINKTIRDQIIAITFTPPPTFGPTNFE